MLYISMLQVRFETPSQEVQDGAQEVAFGCFRFTFRIELLAVRLCVHWVLGTCLMQAGGMTGTYRNSLPAAERKKWRNMREYYRINIQKKSSEPSHPFQPIC